jgi:Cu+-exporting ATPase
MAHTEHNHSHHGDSEHAHCCAPSAHKLTKTLVVDPVCGMKIDPETAKGGSSQYKGQTFFLCNPICKG